MENYHKGDTYLKKDYHKFSEHIEKQKEEKFARLITLKGSLGKYKKKKVKKENQTRGICKIKSIIFLWIIIFFF